MTTLDRTAYERAGADDPEWLGRARAEAFAAFESLQMPSTIEEHWRYLDLDFDVRDFGVATSAADHTAPELGDIVSGPQVVIVDGVVTASSDIDADGVWFGSLASAATDRSEALEGLQGSGVPSDADVFSAAHHAFGTGGAVLLVDRNTENETVLVDMVAATDGMVSFPKLIVVAGESAKASVVVHIRSEGDCNALVVPQIELHSGQNAAVEVSIVQTLDRSMKSIGHLRAVVARDATATVAEAGIGASLGRWDLTVDLVGQGSNAKIFGAYFGDEDQVLDYRYVMHHAGLNTNSEMFLKGAVQDQALSVFTGMIRIDEEAQRTNAYQTNRNLILSAGAGAQSVPNLEILANDVKCGHASSVGPLDEEQRYYLMSRGLDSDRADRLQVRGFFEEAIARFPHKELAEPLRVWMNTKFVEAQKAGRV